MTSTTNSENKLLSLPAELRIHILEYVFSENTTHDGFIGRGPVNSLCGLYLDDDYTVQDYLQPLLVCRQLYQDGHLLAFNKTNFIISNLYSQVPQRLCFLRPKQISAIRSIAFVADARHFRNLPSWGEYPFGIPNLHLDTLTIILYRSACWHYLFDHTTTLVHLLRHLRHVRRIVFVRNAALVKGSLRAWYNRLVGLIMKVDHHERYEVDPPRCEGTWWRWGFDEGGQRIVLEAREGKGEVVGEEEYLRGMVPLMEELRRSVEGEEWNLDPRARRHYY